LLSYRRERDILLINHFKLKDEERADKEARADDAKPADAPQNNAKDEKIEKKVENRESGTNEKSKVPANSSEKGSAKPKAEKAPKPAAKPGPDADQKPAAPADDKQEERLSKDETKTEKKDEPKFVDRQLEKALTYLSAELAKTDEKHEEKVEAK
jgi:hypothetical protein